MLTEEECGFCAANLLGMEIPEAGRESYGNKTHFSRLISVQYGYDHPEHYDGISEYRCPDCGVRVGRWSNLVLQDDEYEIRFGYNE